MSIQIETDRLLLRPFQESDFEAVYEFGSNKKVQEFTGENDLLTLQGAKDIIKNVWFKDYEKHGYGRWATIYKSDNRLIGFTGLKYLEEIDETDIGFRYLPEYWGKGIATEASKEMIRYGFEKLNLAEIIAIAMKENIASNRVLVKIGLNHYKEDEYCGDGGKHNWYKIKRNEYLERKI